MPLVQCVHAVNTYGTDSRMVRSGGCAKLYHSVDEDN